jgi:hypothetical protein
MKLLRRVSLWTATLLACAPVWGGRLLSLRPGEQAAPNQYIVQVSSTPSGGRALLSTLLPKGTTINSIGGGMHVVTLPGGADPMTPARLAQHPLVVYVEPDRIRQMAIQPANDPDLSSQWALQTVQALQAWGMIPGQYTGASLPESSRIKVAVLDTGVDCTHPDFANSGGSSADGAQGGQLSFSLSQAIVATTVGPAACAWQDDSGHGTHVAGVIAAATENGVGVASLGYPLELIVYKVLNSAGNGDDSGIGQAIMDAANAGARVVSMSLGSVGYSQTLQNAINYAWQRDTLVVCAAGNDGVNELFFPANANYAVAAAASDQNNNIANFSNYGNGISVSAPGVNITSTFPTYPVSLTTSLNYGQLSGTSLSTPHVSALAGLLALSTPALPAAAIIQRIQQSATSSTVNGGWDPHFGYGVINAFDAMSGSLRPASNGSVTGQVIMSIGVPIAGVTVSLNGLSIASDSTGLFRFSNLSPGTYTITASGGGYSTQTLSVGVVAGADSNLPIQMGVSYGRFTGTVTDSVGPVAGAIVQALSNGLILASAVADPTGTYSLWVPNGGTFNIRAAGVSRAATTQSQSVGAGGVTTVNLTLLQLGAIEGVVRDASQSPVAGAQILVSGNNFSAGATADGNGTYATPGVPSGSYTVTATATGHPTTTLNNVSAGGGNATVNISMGGSSVSVGISPNSVSLTAGNSQTFTATVTGSSNQGVNWSINPAVGTMSGGVYTAPANIGAAQTITVTATSAADSTKSASAAISLIASPQAPANQPPSLNIGPNPPTLGPSQTQQFTATVTGMAPGVTWIITPSVLGSITQTGLYTAPATIPALEIVNITARSNANPNMAVTTLAFLKPGAPAAQPVSISINPLSTTLGVTQVQQFTAAVSGSSNTAVNWSCSPALGGVSPGGIYTAPAALSSQQTVIVTATSAADSTKSASAAITLLPQLAVLVSPTAVRVSSGQSQQFSAQVVGAPQNPGVTWSIYPPTLGSISSTGLYTAPGSVSGIQIVTITASTVQTPNVSTSTIAFLTQ